MDLSEHLTFIEVTRSDVALRLNIDNIPNETQIEALKLVCENIYEKVRKNFDKPIYIVSGFRCQKLNSIIGGANNSQHTRGQALDLDCDVFGGLTNVELFNYIKNNLDFDQLIQEGGTNGWIHCSYKAMNNRKQSFEIKKP